jgi:hypothetical protein
MSVKSANAAGPMRLGTHLRPGWRFSVFEHQFRVPLTPEQAIQRLKERTRERNLIFTLGTGTENEFLGRVGEADFEIQRDFYYRAPMVPTLLGEIRSTEHGAQVTVVVSFYSVPLLILILLPFLIFWDRAPVLAVVLAPFLLAISVGVFVAETRRSLLLLHQTLGGSR